MSAIAYPATRHRPSARLVATVAVVLGLVVLAIAGSSLMSGQRATPVYELQAPANAAPLDLTLPDGAAPGANDQRPAAAPLLPEQAAERAKGIMRTGTIPAGPLGAESLDSGDGDVACGKTECEP